MTRTPALHDWIVSGSTLCAGILAALLLRTILDRLGERARRTRRTSDDIAVGGLRLAAPWAALLAGVWSAAAAMPLEPATGAQVNHLLLGVLVAVATLATARVVAGLVQAVTLSRSGVAGSATIFVNIVRLTVVGIGLLVLLQTMGVSVAPLLTAFGVGGLAVALALQDTLSNLFAGVHILASKKVQTGDYIQLSTGEQGYVMDINWRNTVVRQLPDNLVIVPNAQLAGAILTNYHRPAPEMGLMVEVRVGYASDLCQVEKVTCDVARDVMADVEGGVPGHDPVVRFHTFGEAGIGFSVVLRAQEFADQYLIKHEFIKRLHQRYLLEDIEIPLPIRAIVLPDHEARVS